MANSTFYKRVTGFITVVLSIWVADALVKQVSFLSSLNNLWGLMLVAGIIYVIGEYLTDMFAKKS
jgi:thiol:disulfide interchange protein